MALTRDELLAELDTERSAITDTVGRIGDEQWTALKRPDGWTAAEIVGHVGDSAYGMALMADRGGPLDETPLAANGELDVDTINEQRRQKFATMERPKIQRRLAGGLHETRCVIEQSPDLDAPGPFANYTKAEWLQRIIKHVRHHREELEGMLTGA